MEGGDGLVEGSDTGEEEFLRKTEKRSEYMRLLNDIYREQRW